MHVRTALAWRLLALAGHVAAQAFLVVTRRCGGAVAAAVPATAAPMAAAAAPLLPAEAQPLVVRAPHNSGGRGTRPGCDAAVVQ